MMCKDKQYNYFGQRIDLSHKEQEKQEKWENWFLDTKSRRDKRDEQNSENIFYDHLHDWHAAWTCCICRRLVAES